MYGMKDELTQPSGTILSTSYDLIDNKCMSALGPESVHIQFGTHCLARGRGTGLRRVSKL